MWLQRLDRESANLGAALRWIIEQNDALSGLRMAGALSRFLQVRSALSEGRNWLAEILLLDRATQAAPLRAKVLYGAGVMASMRNDLTLARKRLEEGAELASASGERLIQALSMGMLAQLELHQGNCAAAALSRSEKPFAALKRF